MPDPTTPDESQAQSAPTSPRNGHAPAVAAPRTNPSDFQISVAEKGGTGRLLAPDQGPPRQKLPGFDPAYVDIVDYIVRITHRIWEQKDIGYIYDCYRHNSRVTDDAGLQYGRDKIVADTIHTINAFPDVRLFPDEVIWASDTGGNFHTSHRTVIVGHNTGYSRWGAPTNRKVVVWCTANCVAHENEIFEEWVIYNTAHLLTQLGFDVRALARSIANESPTLDSLIGARGGEIERLLGQAPPPRLSAPDDERFDVEELLRRTLHNTWNRRDLSALDAAYAPTVRFHGATGRELYGRGAVKGYILSVLAMFPDLAFQIDDVYWMGNDTDGYSVAVRWTALGTHLGNGIYGRPTSRRALLWGISQYHLRDRQIEEEWTVFNEFEVMQQLLRDEPASLPA
jgi:predicted ester cyclase